MYKKSKIIVLCLIIASCNNQNMLITNNSLGNIKIGLPIEGIEYDKGSIEIILDASKNVKTIVISNSIYKTENGFGVGSNLKNIESKLGIPINENLEASKGKISIMDLGKCIFYENIIFIDSDKNDIVDEVIIRD